MSSQFTRHTGERSGDIVGQGIFLLALFSQIQGTRLSEAVTLSMTLSQPAAHEPADPHAGDEGSDRPWDRIAVRLMERWLHFDGVSYNHDFHHVMSWRHP